MQVAEGDADQRRGLQRLGLDHFGHPLLHGIDGSDAALSDMLENTRDCYRARIDMMVDADRVGQIIEARVVDQDHAGLAAQALGHCRAQDVRLVAIGQRHHQICILDIGLLQDVLIECRPMQHDRIAELVRHHHGPRSIALDELHLGLRLYILDRPGDVIADIAGAGDHQSARFLFLVSEQTERAPGVFALADDIGKIADQQLVGGASHLQPAIAIDRSNRRHEVGKELAQLLQRRVEDRAVLHALDRHHGDVIVGKADDVCGAEEGNAPQHHLADLDLRRDRNIDRHVLPAEEIGIFRPQIILRADTGDLGRNRKQRMRHFAGDDIDLVVKGHSDDHVRLIGAGLGKHVRMGAMAHITADVERLGNVRDERSRGVDHRHVVVLLGQPLRDTVADLSRSADNDFHECSFEEALTWRGATASGPLRPLYAKRFQFAMEC